MPDRMRESMTRDEAIKARALARVRPAPGLCATCQHLQLIESAQSVFVLCELSRRDPGMPRYPRLPRLECPGHAPD